MRRLFLVLLFNMLQLINFDALNFNLFHHAEKLVFKRIIAYCTCIIVKILVSRSFELLLILLAFHFCYLCMTDQINNLENISTGKRKIVKLINVEDNLLVALQNLLSYCVHIRNALYRILQIIYFPILDLLPLFFMSFRLFSQNSISCKIRTCPKYVDSQ